MTVAFRSSGMHLPSSANFNSFADPRPRIILEERSSHHSSALSVVSHSVLPNHLRSFRKRVGLSQAEVARLLGCESGSKVSRYERFARTPSLETALACEIIFDVPARILFPGLFARTRRDVLPRLGQLATLVISSPRRRRAITHLEHVRRTS